MLRVPRRDDHWSSADMGVCRTSGRIVMRPYGADLRSLVGAIHESPVDMAALQLKTHKAGGGCLRLNVFYGFLPCLCRAQRALMCTGISQRPFPQSALRVRSPSAAFSALTMHCLPPLMGVSCR